MIRAIVAACLVAAATAPSASALVLLPAAGDYEVRWYESSGARPVDNWQIEVRTHRNPGTATIVNARMGADDGCWALNVPVSVPARTRIRSVLGSQVSSWSIARQLPNASGYRIRWFQLPSQGRPVDDWDLEITPTNNPTPYVVTALAMAEAVCWSVPVPISESANVRIRWVVGSQVSAWSPRTVVPEVGVGTGSLAASALLAVLARRRRRGRRSAGAAGAAR